MWWIQHCCHYAGCLVFDWECEKKIIVSLSTKYWWLVNLFPLSCKTSVDNHLCNMFVEYSAIMPTLE